MAKTYKIASLFSGCGGLDLGFSGGFTFMGHNYSSLPTKIVFANDFDIDASTCYNSNGLLVDHGASCLLEDIRKVDAGEIPDFDILLAGFPCQPFSNAGNRKGVNDDNGRGTLFEECERVLKSKINEGKTPSAFVFENVRGILSSKMPDGTTVPQEIKQRMESLGYNVSIQLVCASDYGVPQKRYRVLIIGVLQKFGQFNFDSMMEVVKMNGIPSEAAGRKEELVLGSILQNLEGVQDGEVWEYTKTTQDTVALIGPCSHGKDMELFFKHGYKLENLPADMFEGRSWKNIPYDKLSDRFRRIADDPKRYHSPKFFRRFAFGEINGTITASAQPENCGITHPTQDRRYSVREAARIQSFPDEYSFGAIPLQSRYKVIGNAVPPVLGWVVASALINHLK